MNVTIADTPVVLSEEEILAFHRDGECIDGCPYCADTQYTREDTPCIREEIEGLALDMPVSAGPSTLQEGRR